MKNGDFSWFPSGVTDKERVLVFVDAKLGYLLNLDGSIRNAIETSDASFYRIFESRGCALQWAELNAPKNREVIYLLYTNNHEEEYVYINKVMDKPLPSVGRTGFFWKLLRRWYDPGR